jgi:hypothetical protein
MQSSFLQLKFYKRLYLQIFDRLLHKVVGTED